MFATTEFKMSKSVSLPGLSPISWRAYTSACRSRTTLSSLAVASRCILDGHWHLNPSRWFPGDPSCQPEERTTPGFPPRLAVESDCRECWTRTQRIQKDSSQSHRSVTLSRQRNGDSCPRFLGRRSRNKVRGPHIDVLGLGSRTSQERCDGLQVAWRRLGAFFKVWSDEASTALRCWMLSRELMIRTSLSERCWQNSSAILCGESVFGIVTLVPHHNNIWWAKVGSHKIWDGK